MPDKKNLWGGLMFCVQMCLLHKADCFYSTGSDSSGSHSTVLGLHYAVKFDQEITVSKDLAGCDSIVLTPAK